MHRRNACKIPRLRPPTVCVADHRFGRDTVERRPASRGEVCCLLSTLVLDRYAVVLLVKLERSVVANLERLHDVSSDV